MKILLRIDCMPARPRGPVQYRNTVSCPVASGQNVRYHGGVLENRHSSPTPFWPVDTRGHCQGTGEPGSEDPKSSRVGWILFHPPLNRKQADEKPRIGTERGVAIGIKTLLAANQRIDGKQP